MGKAGPASMVYAKIRSHPDFFLILPILRGRIEENGKMIVS